MARARTPKAKADITGQSVKQKRKFDARKEPKVLAGVGEPYEWLSDNAKKAWREIAAEIPWLNQSHRGLLSVAAKLRGRMMGDSSNGESDLGIQGLSLYQVCLGKMGATPSDASKVTLPSNDEDDEDDLDD
ncbi:hypothetical protein [Mesorhizobium retamae]|uniref:Terminase n=1 Tax=Mesorhizobium retamae TaxID=2912854 RepID=A0ABS9QJR9_9HYPH|nr:hypothetical protein [Mesorhizobium sp. IRAMC:0171]MCG7507073.1 hypothetical protein [Mesorhizobium sp. IRAMC:0171]